MCKDISTKQNQNLILVEEEVEELPWTVMNFEGKEDMISKNVIEKHDFVVIKDERVPYEECIQTIYKTIG